MIETTPDDDYAFGASATSTADRDESSALAELLENTPSYVARGLIYLVTTFVVVMLAWAWLSKISIVVNLPAQLVTELPMVQEQANTAGTVFEVAVGIGDKVEVGDVVMTLQALQAAERQSAVIRRRRALAQAKRQVEVELPHRRVILEKKLRAVRARLAAAENLSRIRIESAILERQRLEQEYTDDAAQARGGALDLALRAASLEVDARRMQWQVDKFELEGVTADMELHLGDLENVAGNELAKVEFEFREAKRLAGLLESNGSGNGLVIVRATAAGLVTSLGVAAISEPVERGQNLVTILPRDAVLAAELLADNFAIGKLTVGQGVRLKLDAYPYIEYGVLRARIAKIVPTQNDGYRVLAVLAPAHLRRGEELIKIRPGMTATAEVVIGRRSIMAMILDPFRALSEATAD